MSVDAERMTGFETRVNDLTKETGELRGAYDHLATKEDIAELRGKFTGELRRDENWPLGCVCCTCSV